VRCIRVCHTVFAAPSICSTLSFHLRYSMSALHTTSCTSLVRLCQVAGWTYDIANIIRTAPYGGLFVSLYLSHPEILMFVSYYIITVPSFHGEERSDPCGPFLHFRTIDDARAAPSMLDGRAGPGGETLHLGLLCLPAAHLNHGGGEYVRCRSSVRVVTVVR
jgi:hypothetical protein